MPISRMKKLRSRDPQKLHENHTGNNCDWASSLQTTSSLSWAPKLRELPLLTPILFGSGVISPSPSPSPTSSPLLTCVGHLLLARFGTKHFVSINSYKSHDSYIISTSQVEKLRPSDTTRKCPYQDLHSRAPFPEPVLSATTSRYLTAPEETESQRGEGSCLKSHTTARKCWSRDSNSGLPGPGGSNGCLQRQPGMGNRKQRGLALWCLLRSLSTLRISILGGS